MEILLNNRLWDWITTLDGSEKVNFRGSSLNALFPLGRTSLYFPFLQVAAWCWNLITHVFCFGSQEMCSTLEEFQILMESWWGDHAPAPFWSCTGTWSDVWAYFTRGSILSTWRAVGHSRFSSSVFWYWRQEWPSLARLLPTCPLLMLTPTFPVCL